jgi:LPS export ABC transporter protein LptC
MPTRSAFIMTVLIVLALAVFTGLERLEKASRRNLALVLPEIDYRLYGVNLSLFDAESGGKVQITASAVAHYRERDELLVQSPVIDRFGKLGESDRALTPLQNLSAQQAQLFKQGQRIRLFDGVTLQNGQAGDDQYARLDTSELLLFPAEKRAETDQRVQIQQSGATLSGLGLRADFAAQTLEIARDVQARISPGQTALQ